MRCMMKVIFSMEAGNAAARDGSLGKKIEAILNEMKPEAAYFLAQEGQRSGIIVFDLKDPSQIPAVAEPWFLALNAKIELQPCMTPKDLQKAGSGIEKAVKNFG